MSKGERPSSAALAAGLCLIWAMTFIVQRTALREAPPLWVAAGRTVIGAAVLAPWLGAMRNGSWRIAAVLAATNIVGFVGLQHVGLDAIGAGPTAAIVYTQPVLVAVGGHLLLGERLTAMRAAGVLLGFAGVAVVSAHEVSAASAPAVLALLGCAICWAAGTLITRATPSQPVLGIVAAQHLLGAPVLLAAAAAAEEAPSLSLTLAATVLFAGVFGAAGGQLIFTTLLRRGEASTVTAWMFSVPIVSAVLGVLLLGETVRAPLIVGLVLVSVGVRLASKEKGASEAPFSTLRVGADR